MTAVYLVITAAGARGWRDVAGAPAADWHAARHAIGSGDPLSAFVWCAPVAVPAAA